AHRRYYQDCRARWSDERYALDKRFIQLTLLLDQGEEAQGPRWQRGSETFHNLGEVLAKVPEPAVVVSIGKSNGLFHCLLRPPCRPLPAPGTPPARQRWPLAQAAPAAWRGTAGVGAAGGLSNAEEGGLRQTRNAQGACFK